MLNKRHDIIAASVACLPSLQRLKKPMSLGMGGQNVDDVTLPQEFADLRASETFLSVSEDVRDGLENSEVNGRDWHGLTLPISGREEARESPLRNGPGHRMVGPQLHAAAFLERYRLTAAAT
jgi:hypothetical protein